MKSYEYLDNKMKQGKLSNARLAERIGVVPSMISQLRSGARPVNPTHAIRLELASDGFLNAEEISPKFFELLEKIGFTRKKQGNHKEVPHESTTADTPINPDQCPPNGKGMVMDETGSHTAAN